MALCAGALAVAACRESVSSATNPEVHLATSVVWSGGEIVLTSSAFSGPDTLPLVLLDDDTAQVRFVPPDTVFATVPNEMGTRALHVQFAGGTRVAVGSVRIGSGYLGWWEGPSAWGHAVQWPVPGQPRIVVDGETHLILVDVAAHTSAPYLPDSLSGPGCLKGPGRDVDGGLVLMAPPPPGSYSCGPIKAYRDPLAGIATDSGPRGMWWQAARLGPGDWLMYAKYDGIHFIYHASAAVDTADTRCATQPYGIAVSSTGRAVPVTVGVCADGIPVYRRGVLGPAYFIAGFREAQGAQFTDDGDTLFQAATPTGDIHGYVLAARLSQDGSLLRSTRNDQDWSDNLLLDPNGRWIYSVGTWGPNGPLVQVFDRASLRLLTTMQPPPGVLPAAAATAADYYFTPILDTGTRTLYLVGTWSFGSTFATFPIEVFSFQLLD